jgi:hypothetical protein
MVFDTHCINPKPTLADEYTLVVADIKSYDGTAPSMNIEAVASLKHIVFSPPPPSPRVHITGVGVTTPVASSPCNSEAFTTYGVLTPADTTIMTATLAPQGSGAPTVADTINVDAEGFWYATFNLVPAGMYTLQVTGDETPATPVTDLKFGAPIVNPSPMHP